MDTEIIHWARHALLSQGYTLAVNQPATIVTTPWSTVLRFETTTGYIYLKQTPAALAIEATIIQLLQQTFHVPVASVIAHNPALHCFLMKDAGQTLRSLLKQQFDEALLCKGIDIFTSVQRQLALHTSSLLNIGVPDWRLDKLPGLFQNLLAEKTLLLEEGFVESDLDTLSSLLPKLSSLCNRLVDYPIKQTIVQPDFNDNNMLVDTHSQTITLIDLGEIAITHPFFSLLNILQQLTKHHGLTADDAAYQRIKAVCFNPYMLGNSRPEILDAFALAEVLWPVYGMLAYHRLMLACGKALQPGRLRAEALAFVALTQRSEVKVSDLP